MITKIYIHNFKSFRDFDLSLNDDLNIIVGDNEAGKSSILEAIGLALTRRLNGRQVETELSPHLFNQSAVAEYVEAVRAGSNPDLPCVVIEAYLSGPDSLNVLRGSNNHEKSDAVGVQLEIAFNDEYAAEYEAFLEDRPAINTIPIEYYSVRWCSFAGAAITSRSLPVGLSYIDATVIRLQSGTDYYLQNIINSSLDPKERVALSMAYRGLKEKFSGEPAIQGINAKLKQQKGAITDKDLAISIDLSQKANWEANLSPHLDDLPFSFVGKGEQSALKIMLALDRHAADAHVILIEEPENHLSFSSMQMLVAKIREKCEGKQIILTTHSAYVLNKLGMEKTILLSDGRTSSLANLPTDTQNYFKKLPGYDTLRVILAKRCILVEGPSDELIVQKAYHAKHGHTAADDGVDVLSVRGLSAPRFLDIAKELNKNILVLVDNDGDYQRKVVERYAPYANCNNITISADPDHTVPTLEDHILRANGRTTLNGILGKDFTDEPSLRHWMVSNKTECALRLFETGMAVTIPGYILNAL